MRVPERKSVLRVSLQKIKRILIRKFIVVRLKYSECIWDVECY